MTKQIPTPPPPEDATECLLRDLIGECHAMIREQVRPSYEACEDPYRRDSYVHSAIGLAKAAAELSGAISRLRGGEPSPELRQRITVERVQRLSNAGEGGG